LIDEGPYLPDDAVEQSLVDGLRYEDELLGQDPLPEEGLHRLLYQDYRLVDPRPLGLNQGPEIAVIYAVGTITFGASGVDVSGSEVLGSEAIVAAIREAREDPAVEAIIVRIDSPGGAAVASDIIWRELALAREAKPVIASMSDLAASGGYYIAAPADVVVAQPGTLTGSIGVVAGKFVIDGALDKLGINGESVTNGRSAEFNSVFLPFSEDSRAKLQQQIDATYETFLLRVAEGREMSRDDVHAVAQGRVWTGRQAQENGLVDELGGFRRAVEIAKERAGIATDLEVTLVPYPKPPSLLEMLSEGVGGPVAVARHSLSGGEKLRASVPLPFRLFRPSQPLALMPGWIPMLLNY
jgi:protease-4